MDELRKRRMQEEYSRMMKAQQLEAQMKTVLKHILDSEAYERAMNIRLSNPEMYQQIVSLLAQLYQSKQLNGKITDQQFKKLLIRVTPDKPETTISFKRK